eukprot:gene4463-4888_t
MRKSPSASASSSSFTRGKSSSSSSPPSLASSSPLQLPSDERSQGKESSEVLDEEDEEESERSHLSGRTPGIGGEGSGGGGGGGGYYSTLPSVDESYPLRIYTDEQYRQRRLSSNADRVVPKAHRLHLIDPLLAAFNSGDFEKLIVLFRERCLPSIDIRANSWQCTGRGTVSLLALLSLLHEVYPDAVIEVLERRFRCGSQVESNSSNNNSNDSNDDDRTAVGDLSALSDDRQVELICRFAGTRITDYPLTEPFDYLSHHADLQREGVQHEVLAAVVMNHLSVIHPSHFQDAAVVFILEMVLAWDSEDKIVSWTFDTLAFSSSSVTSATVGP